MRLYLLPLFLLFPLFAQGEILTRVSMEDIVQRLHDRGVAVCFERFPNTKKDAITVSMKIAELEVIPSSQRTEKETNQLRSCKNALKTGAKEKTVIDWRQKTFDFDLPENGKTENILDLATKADSDYEWKKILNSFVVYPKIQSFNRPIKEFIIVNVSFETMLSKMNQTVSEKPNPLNYMEVQTGPGPSLSEMFKDRKFTIKLKNTDTRTVLCAIMEQLGPDFYWTVLGGEDWGRNLGFGRAR